MKHIITALLCALSMQMAVPAHLYAATSTDDQLAQIRALQSHLTRLTGSVPNTRLDAATMERIIDDSIDWMLTAQEGSGHFSYEYLPYEGRYLNDDNIVRQGGALFILGEVYRRQTTPDSKLRAAIERAIGYFENQTIEGRDGDEEFRCVANTERSSTCKLGSTSLVLLGILAYEEVSGESPAKYRALIRDYVDYILASQTREGGFRHEYRATSGFGTEESPYSNGEALLALAHAYEYSDDPEIKEVIDRAFPYLAAKEYEVPLYLWVTAALKSMYKSFPDPAYIQYARDFTEWRIKEGPYDLRDRNYCAHVEGIASAYSVIEHDPLPGELARLRLEIDRFNAYHAGLQVKSDDTYHLLTTNEGIALSKLTDPARAVGGFLTAHSNPSQRIDFTQHCASAYLQTYVDIDGNTI